MENFFKFKERGTDMKTEMIAGVTTFMTMAYILAVNPNILGASGMDTGAIFTATALASAIASFCMALFANLPFVLSAGMGLNAYFAYTVVLGMGYSWEVALTAVSVSYTHLDVYKRQGSYCRVRPCRLPSSKLA